MINPRFRVGYVSILCLVLGFLDGASLTQAQPDKEIDRLAKAYRAAKTEFEQRTVCLDAIDTGVIADGRSVAVVDGTDSRNPNWPLAWMTDNTSCELIDCKSDVDCKKGRRKVVAFVDLDNHFNWHFMRQQCDGKWTSKNGTQPIVNAMQNEDEYYVNEYDL